jgi:EmrB/QacA subfamily drug resistance transporter
VPPSGADTAAAFSTSAAAPPPRAFRDSLLAMLGIGLVNMLVALDQTVVSTALPSIVSELRGFEYYAWIASAYLLASVVTVPVFGRLGDYFGRKPFVIAAIVVFTTASVLCGLAPSMLALVVARGLQGVGGGMMVGTAFASIPDLFPDPARRVRWQVVMAAAYGIGTAAGPSLGGFLSEHYGWRSTFLVNLPVGIAGFYCVSRYLPRFKVAARGPVTIDWAGAALIAITLGCLQLCVENLPTSGLSHENLILLAVVVLAGTAFLFCEKWARHPIVPLDLFANSRLVVLFTLSVLAGVAMFSLIFYTPLMLQGGFSLSPQDAGLLATPLPVCIAMGSFINTWIVLRLKKPTMILTAGFSLILLACLGVAATQVHSPGWLLELSLACGGVGLGFVLNNMNVFTQEIAGRDRLGIATALMQSTRMVGGMFGTAAVGTLVSHSYANGVRTMLESAATPTVASNWTARFADPRILMDLATRNGLLSDLKGTSIDGPFAIEAARQVLVGAIHNGLLMTAIAVLGAVLLVGRISDVRLHSKPASPFIEPPH